jgi:hypothetical protein
MHPGRPQRKPESDLADNSLREIAPRETRRDFFLHGQTPRSEVARSTPGRRTAV